MEHVRWSVGTYRELAVWRRSVELALEVYQATSAFPSHETYGLRAQLRKAAVSIPSNLVEGKGRYTDREFRRFVRLSIGSLLEVETQLVIAERLGYLTAPTARSLSRETAEIGKMLSSLAHKLTTED